MSLKEKLGEDGYAELMALLSPAPSTWRAWVRGALKSWTTWFGAVLVAGPELLPALMPHFKELLTPDTYSRAVQVVGIVVMLLRVKTTTSLAEKGKV